MKFVLMSDTHDRHGLFKVPEGDVLLHAGDFTFRGEALELVKFNAWLDNLEFDHKVIIPGNHDLSFETQWDLAASAIPAADAILNQSAYEIEGFKIWGEPRQPWFCDWAFNVGRDKMKFVWEKVPKDTDILVTHGPPFRAGDLTTGRFRPVENAGCVWQRKWIEQYQPKLVVCGHIHSGYGLYKIGKTIVANASVCNERYQPVNKPIVVTL